MGAVVVSFSGPKVMPREPGQGSRAQGQALASTWHFLGQAWGPGQVKIVSLGLKRVGEWGKEGSWGRKERQVTEINAC